MAATSANEAMTLPALAWIRPSRIEVSSDCALSTSSVVDWPTSRDCTTPSSDSSPDATAVVAEVICALAFCSELQAEITDSLIWSRAASASTSLLICSMLALRMLAP